METEVYARSRELSVTNRQLRESNEALQNLHRQIGQLMAQADSELQVGPGESTTNVAAATSGEMLERVGKLITTRNQLEEQLRQSQKMDAIGRLAGGIAHDFNNLLTAILGYNEMLRDELTDRPAALDFAEEVRLAAERATSLTYQLLRSAGGSCRSRSRST
jgi:signal transduction histidine kinase